jgi:Alpha/beta hydrolase family
MPALTATLSPMLSLLTQIGREPAAPFRLWFRTTSRKLRPSQPVPHVGTVRQRQDSVLASGRAGLHQCATVLVESRSGAQPTIVIGGFVPDATESVYLLRDGLLQQGSVYYFNYPLRGFSIDLFLAQLEDLVEETAAQHRRPPVLLAVSFGAGLAIEMCRRATARGAALPVAGLVLVSPVACVDDLLDPDAPKPTTLLGRVIKPYLDARDTVDETIVERSRSVFLKMFESGAQNKEALRLLLTRREVDFLRDAVLATINSIKPAAAKERVCALRDLAPLDQPRPLTHAPVLVLFSEKESSVLREGGPTERELRARVEAWFPRGRCLTVTNRPEHPVQHASLIFHARNFRPLISSFYRSLRQSQRRAA